MAGGIISSSIRETWINFRRTSWMNFVSIGMIAAVTLILGIFGLLALNLSGLVNSWREQVQIILFLEEGLNSATLAKIQKKVAEEPAVKSFTYVSKSEALSRFRQEAKSMGDLLRGLDENPLPASLEIKVRPQYQDGETLARLAEDFGKLKGVEDVLYGQEWVERLLTFFNLLELLGLGLGGLLLLSALFIVANTIRLTVMARKEEMEILLAVGATKGYISRPYLLEGMIHGLLGVGVALALLYGLYQLLLSQMSFSSAAALGIESVDFLDPLSLAAFFAGGILVGLGGSWFSVRRYLKIS
jgi:cell division transport system permease protein